MRTELIRIGNSRGIRIPKPLIEECNLDGGVELTVEKDRLIISRERRARADWDTKFLSADNTKDELLLELAPNRFDHEEWTW